MATCGTPSAEGAPRGTVVHVPVLLSSMLEALAPRPQETYIDATFGAGGYSSALLDSAAESHVLAIDRDPAAIAAGRALAERSQGRLTLIEGRFGALDSIAEAARCAPIHGVIFDLGVSSVQLDTPERGFSFQSDGPLDMRMSSSGPTVAEVLASAPEELIAEILFTLGEERSARAIARAIVARRAQKPLTRTGELAALTARVLGREKIAGRHAATRTFQALRLYVNDELGELARGLAAAERVLAPGGRLVVVTFHSLEDRLVKQFLRRRAAPPGQGSRHMPPRDAGPAGSFRFINSRPVSPGQDEVASNPRARSAKLRAAIRTDAPAWRAAADALPGPHRSD